MAQAECFIPVLWRLWFESELMHQLSWMMPLMVIHILFTQVLGWYLKLGLSFAFVHPLHFIIPWSLYYLLLYIPKEGESNGKLPPRTCPGCSVPEPRRSHDWALVSANLASEAEYYW